MRVIDLLFEIRDNRVWKRQLLEWNNMEPRMDSQLLHKAEECARQPYRIDVTLGIGDSGKPIYVARVPELHGCVTHGETANEARERMNVVIVDFIYTMLEDGLYVPAPIAAKTLNAIDEEIQRLFSLATLIDLEPGMDNEFSIGLEDAIERGGKPALQAIERLVLTETVPSSIAMDALEYIGDTDSDKYRSERREMLERCLLNSNSAWVRDGAGLGIAALDDPLSLPVLEIAIARESSKALKSDLGLVREQLIATKVDA